MAETQLARLVGSIEERRGDAPIVVGLDGRSGAGKSTLAASLGAALGDAVTVLIIEGDEFYAGGRGATWDERTPEQKADQVIDWRRQHAVLTELLTAGQATWRPFDWEADDWDGEPPPFADPVDATVAEVIVLEGAYSCRPELHALLDLTVLLATPEDERRRRLLGREGDEYRTEWEARWGQAEDHYFGATMPPERFDLVL